jgi:riboflavin kinase/FMN adenylyltransferase
LPSIPPPLVAATTGRWTPDSPACAVAVGNFDGVHLGHAAIARRLVDTARRLGLPAVALSFDPHPAAVLRPEAAPATLTTSARRAELLLALGVDAVLVQPTDRELLSLSAERFFTDLLHGRLGARAIVEGTDFRFGAGRSGDLATLASLCSRDGIVVEAVAPVTVAGEAVSSSRIRGLVAAGRVGEAATMLTAAYRLRGTVVAGAGRGKPLGFPTANLERIATLRPAPGVYAAVAAPAGAAEERYPAAVHVGRNETFGAEQITVEAHLIGFSGTLYGSDLDVDFLERLRDTHRFASVDELKAQLAADVARAEKVARSLPPGTRVD